MNDSPSTTTEPTAPEPVAPKPAASAKRRVSTALKTKVVAKTVKTPPTAQSTSGKPVAKALVAAPKKSPVEARIKPAAPAKPTDAPVLADNAKVKTAVIAGSTQALAPAVSQAKKAKETKHPGKKSKLVRDSFTFPVADYALIGVLKQRALKAGHEIKKSELLRAGLLVLSALSDATLIKALGGIDKLKPGRPSK